MITPKEPYRAWSIDETKFPTSGSIEEKANFLLNYAILAPSAFNVQPWLFKVRGNKILIHPDFSRSLSTSDKNNRLLYLSIGCVLKNIEVAAKAFGINYKRSIRRDGRESFAEITLDLINGSTEQKSLLNQVKNRLTNRSPYILEKKLSRDFVETVASASNWQDVKVVLIQDQNKREKITNLTVKADLLVWNNLDFKSQHLKWVRHNLTKERDGMPAFTVGIPLFVSFFAKLIISNPNFAKLQANKNRRLLQTTPYFTFILSERHTQETWIRVGEIFEEISLIATEEGIAVAPLAEVVEVGKIYKETMRILKTNLRPQIFFRMGYPTKQGKKSPRRSLSGFLAN